MEQHRTLGSEISSRNSGVLHAGLHYPKTWLKTQLCLDGHRRLLRFCHENKVPLLRCGKLIVSSSEKDLAQLKKLETQALDNGVRDVQLLTAKQARDLEPQLSCYGALYSPSTSVIDSDALCRALENSFVKYNGFLSLQTKLENIELLNNKCFKLTISNPSKDGVNSLVCQNLILATGLSSSQTGIALAPYLKIKVPETYFARGHYYYLKKGTPFSHLVYPLPSNEGLGIHFTLSLNGQAKFGPDVEWSAKPSLKFDHPDERRLQRFIKAIRRYWPEIREDALEPGYIGVRPRLYSSGDASTDFGIYGPEQHGLSNLVLLFGIESPGLTSCLSIGTYVANMLEGRKSKKIESYIE